MNAPFDLHVPVSILQPVAGSRLRVIAGEGLPRGPSLTGFRERSDSSGVNSNAVTRAIEDLKGSAAFGRSTPPRRDHGARPCRGTASGSRRGTDADPVCGLSG